MLVLFETPAGYAIFKVSFIYICTCFYIILYIFICIYSCLMRKSLKKAITYIMILRLQNQQAKCKYNI